MLSKRLNPYHDIVLMDVPEPPNKEFVKLVRAELDDARRRCRQMLGKRTNRSTPGFCVGCGRPHATNTPGCPNCSARHGMRALKERRKAKTS